MERRARPDASSGNVVVGATGAYSTRQRMTDAMLACPFLILAIALAIIVGWQTRVAALLLAGLAYFIYRDAAPALTTAASGGWP